MKMNQVHLYEWTFKQLKTYFQEKQIMMKYSDIKYLM